MPFELSASDSACVELMKRRLSGFETEIGRLDGLSYTPRTADEVIITTSPKAGTTWVQQICHQLRSGPPSGDMSFNEISEVVPWLELAYDQGQDLKAPQPFEAETGGLRVFKSHAWERHCPKGCKYIVVVRDPCDVALSFFNFFQGWFFEPGDISVDAFVQEFWLRRGVPDSKMQNASFFHHLLSWYTKRNDNDTLFLFFEDLKEDLPSQVRRIAEFISNDKWKCTDAAIDNAVRMSSFSFMREHSGHFNETLSKKARNVACGLSPDAGMNDSKVRSGKTGAGMKILSEELRAQISEKWIEVVGRETGFNSYEDLRSHVKEEEEAATK